MSRIFGHFRTVLLTLIPSAAILTSCVSDKAPREGVGPKEGPWRMVLDVGDASIPLLLDLHKDDSSYEVQIHNADEIIRINGIKQRGDSLCFRMPLFDSAFRGVLVNDSTWIGAWHNFQKGPDHTIPFVARASRSARFPGQPGNASVTGSWHVRFSGDTDNACDAIGVFEERQGGLYGTFLTETGDYRYLEGAVHGDSMMLSCFDGSHAFLFKAHFRNDSLFGHFWSGKHWNEPWSAGRDPAFRLGHPDSLTYMREGHTLVDFSFPNISGGTVSLRDPEYLGKVVLIQVMGSWCPNCVDETRLLTEMYSRYHDDGMEVIALAFEKHSDPTKAQDALIRFRDVLNVPYTIAYAGLADKKGSAKKLPFLNHLMSFPTCIFVDRTGTVRRIRTGFYGPGTGEYHGSYKREVNAFVETLLNEGASRAEN